MDDEIFLERPSVKHKMQAINFIEEVEKVDDLRIRYSGFSRLQNYRDNYEDWLKEIELYSKKETVKEGLVPADVFFSIRKQDNKVVGIINIRRELNDFLYDFGGHIGYSILPSERRKGYAYKQLLLALKYCKSIHINRVLITCLEENIESYKTIEKAGGVLENIVKNEKENKTLKRYWISLKKRYADRHVGERTQNTELKAISVKDNCFKGDIYFYSFNDVKQKLLTPKGKCLLDNNYKWLEFYNYDSKIKLTAFYNENNSIIEWYFDIARKIGKDNGVPYEDELKEAFDKREMTKAEYDEAYKVAYDLMENLKINKIKLQEYTDKYLDNFLMLKD